MTKTTDQIEDIEGQTALVMKLKSTVSQSGLHPYEALKAIAVLQQLLCETAMRYPL